CGDSHGLNGVESRKAGEAQKLSGGRRPGEDRGGQL
ncbi:hypothetical protein HKBW3S43_02019, partial [Candidatus Hakubella thermalkaliphila]